MSEVLLAAILNFAARFGIDAAMAFLQSRGATIDDAINALQKASEKSLADYVSEDLAKRKKALFESTQT